MEIQAVSRKQRAKAVEEKRQEEQVLQPVARTRFVPAECSLCAELRPKDKSYVRVYHTAGAVRYCKCDYCGNTWKQHKEKHDGSSFA